MKRNHLYRVVDQNNSQDLTVEAKSVAHAASIARKIIAKWAGKDFKPWQTESTTGGWKGISIDMPSCVHVQVPPPKPKPTPRNMARKQAAQNVAA